MQVEGAAPPLRNALLPPPLHSNGRAGPCERCGWPLALAAVGAVAASPAWAGDATAGRAVFNSQCSSCHSDAKSRPVVVGPPLYGVVGRHAGSVPGYPYSSTMKSAGFEWTPDRLRAYLPAPRDYLPGVKMTYNGLKDPSKLDSLIAYLQTLK
jgi:cytochrome c